MSISHPRPPGTGAAPTGTTSGACTTADGLDELVCFDLYAASRSVTAAYRPVLSELGLTYPQYLVLVVLWDRGACSIKHLASTLRLDHATLTPLLRRMEEAGLLVRERSLIDERSVTVRLTGRGDSLRDVREGVRCHIADLLGLDVDQVDALQGLLRQVSANLADRAV
ncbi:MarR family transcriptional regulator [Nocardioides lentus]|uniref:MarR family transcriptional regulator n=1 Tax=Nocardioides lentus TaxID=338077 RepID=A0ABP5AK01_9ACTN